MIGGREVRQFQLTVMEAGKNLAHGEGNGTEVIEKVGAGDGI